MCKSILYLFIILMYMPAFSNKLWKAVSQTSSFHANPHNSRMFHRCARAARPFGSHSTTTLRIRAFASPAVSTATFGPSRCLPNNSSATFLKTTLDGAKGTGLGIPATTTRRNPLQPLRGIRQTATLRQLVIDMAGRFATPPIILIHGPYHPIYLIPPPKAFGCSRGSAAWSPHHRRVGWWRGYQQTTHVLDLIWFAPVSFILNFSLVQRKMRDEFRLLDKKLTLIDWLIDAWEGKASIRTYHHHVTSLIISLNTFSVFKLS